MGQTIAGVDHQVAFGLAGILAGLLMLVLTWMTIDNLGSHSRASIAMVLPEPNVERGVFVLTVCFVFLVIGMFAGAAGLVWEHATLDLVSRTGVGIGVFGLMVYLRTLEQATSEREFDDLIGGIVEYGGERASHRAE